MAEAKIVLLTSIGESIHSLSPVGPIVISHHTPQFELDHRLNEVSVSSFTSGASGGTRWVSSAPGTRSKRPDALSNVRAGGARCSRTW